MSRRLTYLRDRRAVAGLWGRKNFAIVPGLCLFFTIAGVVIADGIDLLQADVRGTVSITDCSRQRSYRWTCYGTFTAADGSLRIDRIRLYGSFAERKEPATTFTARVSGPDAGMADRYKNPSPGVLVGGILLAFLGVFLTWAFYGAAPPPQPTIRKTAGPRRGGKTRPSRRGGVSSRKRAWHTRSAKRHGRTPKR